MLVGLGTYRVKRKRRRGESKNKAQGLGSNGPKFLWYEPPRSIERRSVMSSYHGSQITG